MSNDEKILMKQLSDLIREKFGTLERFCNEFGYKYDGIYYMLSGRAASYDPALYDGMLQHVKDYKPTTNTEVVLLTRIIEKHYGSIEAFCRSTRLHKKTVLRIISEANTSSAEFIKIAHMAYSSYLHKLEGIEEYVNTIAPGKFLNQQAMRKQNLRKLGKG